MDVDSEIINHLLFHRALTDEIADISRIDNYIEMVKQSKEGSHISISDPFDKSIAIAFELVIKQHLDPWNIDLVKFSTLYLKRAKEEKIDLVTAGKIIYMAWKVLKLQSDELVEYMEKTRNIEQESFGWDDLPLFDDWSFDNDFGYTKMITKKENITSVLMCDFIPDVSDFEDVKCLWEEIQDAIDFVNLKTGRSIDLAVVQTTNSDFLGRRPEFAKATFNLLKNEILSANIPDDETLAVILGEHGCPPGFAEQDTSHSYTMPRIRENVLNYMKENIGEVRSGKTEFALSMNEFCNRPDDGHASTMERIYEFLEKGFKNIIICSYYFPYESNDLFRHLRHWAFDFEDWMKIPHEESKALHKVLPNYRSEGTIRGSRIIITGSVLGRYEKEPENELLKQAHRYYLDAMVDLIARKLDSL